MADPNQFISALAKKLSLAPQVPQVQALEAAATAEAFANQLAKAADIPELVTFTGYLGGTFDRDGTNWRVLYLDTRLQSWLLVKDSDVLHSASVESDTSPSNKRDVIWVEADAPVGGGGGSPSVENRFLTGDFTRAADYEAPPGGGTTAATGVFCEARTSSCCRRQSQGPR